MIEITIRTKDEDTFLRLLNFISKTDLQIVGKKEKTTTEESSEIKLRKGEDPDREKYAHLPITWAEEPDVNALVGIWKDKQMTLEKLRKLAWGDRL